MYIIIIDAFRSGRIILYRKLHSDMALLRGPFLQYQLFAGCVIKFLQTENIPLFYQVALRFLQIKLFNDSFYQNAVELYDGEWFVADQKIGQILPNATDAER